MYAQLGCKQLGIRELNRIQSTEEQFHLTQDILGILSAPEACELISKHQQKQ